MRVESATIWTFHLPFQTGLVSINVQAPSQAEAAKVVKDWMDEAQKELALMFPQVSPLPQAEPQTFNAMQIGLLEDLSAKAGRTGEPLQQFILDKTGLEMTLENIKGIIPKLEGMQANNPGAPIIGPDNGKKDKK